MEKVWEKREENFVLSELFFPKSFEIVKRSSTMSQDKATPEEEKRFQQEVDLDKDLRERYKREALKKCAAEHLAYIECLDKGKTCVKEDKAFWDCYRAQRVRLFFFSSAVDLNYFWCSYLFYGY